MFKIIFFQAFYCNENSQKVSIENGNFNGFDDFLSNKEALSFDQEKFWNETTKPHLVHLEISLALFPSFQSYQLVRYCSRNNVGCRYCVWKNRKFFNNCSTIPRFSSSQFDSFQLNETIPFSIVLLLLNIYFIVYVIFNDLILYE